MIQKYTSSGRGSLGRGLLGRRPSGRGLLIGLSPLGLSFLNLSLPGVSHLCLLPPPGQRLSGRGVVGFRNVAAPTFGGGNA